MNAAKKLFKEINLKKIIEDLYYRWGFQKIYQSLEEVMKYGLLF